MAGSREAQNRYRFIERRVHRRVREEMPDVYAAWCEDFAREWDEKEKGRGHPVP